MKPMIEKKGMKRWTKGGREGPMNLGGMDERRDG